VQRETGTCVLPCRRRVDVAAFSRACGLPWHCWPRGALARAEQTADGRVHLLVVRRHARGASLRVTGVGAAEAERLAPLAARVRRALGLDGIPELHGTSPFEDALVALLRDGDALLQLLELGRRCPAAPAIRTMPRPSDVLAVPTADLVRRAGSVALARRIQALARAFVAGRPSVPSAS
jgi:hypothetical protein